MADLCGDCRRPPWPGDRTARAGDCLANETVEGGRECARITVHRLRSELAEKERESGVVWADARRLESELVSARAQVALTEAVAVAALAWHAVPEDTDSAEKALDAACEALLAKGYK